MRSVQLNGWQGKAIAGVMIVGVAVLSVGATFTWRVFDNLMSAGAQEAEIRHLRELIEANEDHDNQRTVALEARLRQDIATLGANLSAQIDAAMQDRCFGAECRELYRRVGEVESDIETLHPRGRGGGGRDP